MYMDQINTKIKPTDDFIFKRLFGTEENKDILIAFLNALFDEFKSLPRIEDIELQNSELIKRYDDSRSGCLDIKAKVKDNTFIDIEVQAKDTGNLVNRGIFYDSFMLVNNIEEGNDLINIPKVISIWIVKGKLKEDNIFYNYKSPLALCNIKTDKSKLDDDIITVSDNFNILFIFLSKLKEGGRNEDLENWLKFIDNQDVLSVGNKDITRANDKLNILRGSNKIKEEYEAKFKAMVKYNMDKSYAKEEGLREGLKKGRQRGLKEGMKQGLKEGEEKGLKKGKQEMARNMLKDNVDITIISRYTGLTIEEIQEL